MKKKAEIKTVVSLFDGIACARVALKLLGHKPTYFASEIESHALELTRNNWKDVVQLGDIKEMKALMGGKIAIGNRVERIGKVDLLIGGSPCQDLSVAKAKRQGLKGARSGLFYEYARLLKELKPKWFILENVASMPKEAREEISKVLGVEPIMINAALVSAQNRKRLFWTNIPGVTQPEDRGIMLEDIIHETRGEAFDVEKYIVKGNHLEWIKDPIRLKKKYTQINGDKVITMMARQYANWNGQYMCVRIGKIGKGGQGERIYSVQGKAIALPASPGYSGTKTGIYLIHKKARGKNRGGLQGGKTPTLTSSSWEDNNHLVTGDYVRKLTPVECERLQSLPDGYTAGISDSQRYKALGNAFNVEVVRHIISHIPKQ